MNEIKLLKENERLKEFVNNLLNKLTKIIKHDVVPKQENTQPNCRDILLQKMDKTHEDIGLLNTEYNEILSKKIELEPKIRDILLDVSDYHYHYECDARDIIILSDVLHDSYDEEFSREVISVYKPDNDDENKEYKQKIYEQCQEIYNESKKLGNLLDEKSKLRSEINQKWWCVCYMSDCLGNVFDKKHNLTPMPLDDSLGVPQTDCEKKFIALAEHAFEVNDDNYTEHNEKLAIRDLFKAGFSRDEISATLEKYSPVSAYDKALVEKNIQMVEKNMKNTRGR